MNLAAAATATQTKRVTLNRDGFPGYYTAEGGRFEIQPMDKKYLCAQRYVVRDLEVGDQQYVVGLDGARETIGLRVAMSPDEAREMLALRARRAAERR